MEGKPPLQYVCSLNSKAGALGMAVGMTRVEIETFPSVTAIPRFSCHCIAGPYAIKGQVDHARNQASAAQADSHIERSPRLQRPAYSAIEPG